MSEAAIDPAADGQSDRPDDRRSSLAAFLSWLAKALVALSLLLILVFAAFVAFLDTGPGRRLIVDRISAMSPETGLRVRIGRIDGSIWGRTQLRDVRLYDPDGLFAESSLIDMDWRPIRLLFGRLLIHELESDLVTLHRLPELIPGDEPRPILPDYDIHIGRLDVAQLRLGEQVTGEARSGRLQGEAEIRRGRALIELDARVVDGGDQVRVRIDAEPDRDRFDTDIQVVAPENSVIGAMVGTRRAIRLHVGGDGSWTRWSGEARLLLSGRPTAILALAMNSGDFQARGWAAPAPFLTGKLARLTSPRILVAGRGHFADRRVEGSLDLRSAAVRANMRGAVDLASNRYDDVEIALRLLRPNALFSNMSGQDIRLAASLDGRFGGADFLYQLTAPRLAFDQTGFDQVRIEGRGRLSRWPVAVPAVATARRVTGVGDDAEAILANLRVQGQLRLTPRLLNGEDLVVTSDKLRGRAGLAVDLRTGVYSVALNAGLPAYEIAGFGQVDILAELRAIPGPGGRGTRVSGQARSGVRRMDNGFLAWVAGGLPQLRTELTRGPDGIVHFSNMRIEAPSIRLSVQGHRRRDGSFSLRGVGEHGDYGPMAIELEGRLERPRLAVRLDRPVPALGLSDVLLNLVPSESGFAWQARGGSTLGPFTGHGDILLPPNAPVRIRFAALEVSGTRAEGLLRSDPGGFTGRLDVAGGGLEGRLAFNPVGGHQRIQVDLAARDAHFIGPPPIVVRRGTIQGVVILDPAGTSVEGKVAARGLSRGPLTLANLDAQASLRAGRGRVEARFAGSRGRGFSFASVASVEPGRFGITGKGTLDRRPIELLGPAVVSRTEDGWRLDRTRLRFAGGTASLAAQFGGRTEIDARLEAMPLTILDIGFPELGLGGIASGSVRYRFPSAGEPPTGEAKLQVRGLTRAGLVLSSRPVDIGLNARLDGGRGALRAVAVSEGRTIGRAQAMISPIGRSGTLQQRLLRAPMRAQLRYNGAADTLWRLTGIELIDLSGPAAIGADFRGTIENPVINGSVRTANGRLESAVTGMVIEGLDSVGRFDGSQLRIQRFQGRTAGSGQVSGSGMLDFAGARGVGMHFDVAASEARLLDRDDIRASVTGNLAIRSNGEGGTISGEVHLAEGRFRLGSATEAASISRLAVTEINRADDDPGPSARRLSPWRLDLDVDAPGRMEVTGLGMSSEWQANVKVGGTVTEPRITGEAELLRGSYDFAGRRFDLIRGTLRFLGESPINPQLDIAAEARVRGLNAQIRVTGRSLRPEIAFTSIPALPQDELLSRILFGTSITNLSAPEAVQLAAAVASLNDPDGGLDPINAVRRSIGLDRLRILPADVTQGIGTQIAAGKYLGRRVYVEVVTDGRGYSATIVEYQITRWLSLLSSISTIGRESVNLRISRDY